MDALCDGVMASASPGVAKAYASSDGGATWMEAAVNAAGNPSLVVFRTTSEVWATTTLGAHYSEDGGATWKDATLDAAHPIISSSVFVDFYKGDSGYLGSLSTLYRLK
jgi:hypothetical protein